MCGTHHGNPHTRCPKGQGVHGMHLVLCRDRVGGGGEGGGWSWEGWHGTHFSTCGLASGVPTRKIPLNLCSRQMTFYVRLAYSKDTH